MDATGGGPGTAPGGVSGLSLLLSLEGQGSAGSQRLITPLSARGGGSLGSLRVNTLCGKEVSSPPPRHPHTAAVRC